MYPGGAFQYNKDPNNQIYVIKQYDFVTGKTKDEEKAEWKQQNKDRREWAKPNVVELPLDDKVIDWFGTRGIERETLQYFKVTQSIDWMPDKSEGIFSAIFFTMISSVASMGWYSCSPSFFLAQTWSLP